MGPHDIDKQYIV